MAGREQPRNEPLMERVLVVIAPFADGVQTSEEVLANYGTQWG